MTKNFSRGMTVFVAVLVVSMLSLAVLSVTNIALKGVLISGSIRSSQQAYFAADSGMECAVAYDTHEYVAEEDYFNVSSTPSTPIRCASEDAVLSKVGSGNIVTSCLGGGPTTDIKTTFQTNIRDESGKLVCAVVNVTKSCKTISPGTNYVKTDINSKGYNVPCSEVMSSGRAVERFVWMTY